MNLSPLPVQKFFDNNGRPLVSGLLFTYVAGTTTKIATFKDQAGTSNTNPVVLDYRGEANVWLDPALTYKFVLAPAGDTDPPTKPIWTVDMLAAGLTLNEVTAEFIGSILYPKSQTEINAGAAIAAFRYPYGHAWRYGCDPGGVVDTTTQLNIWLACGYKDLYLPAGTYICTNVTQATRSNIKGDGPRMSVLRQKSTATGPLLTLQTGIPPAGGVNDITEGSFTWQDWGIQPRALAGCHGVVAAGGLFSMLRSFNFRIQNQQSETLGAPPYPVIADTRGISLDGAAGATIFMSNHINLEIRSCESAVYGRTTVNEQQFHGWFIDCKYGFNVDTISTWRSQVTHETSVASARAWLITTSISNIDADLERWELTQAGSFGVEFSGVVAAANINFNWPHVLISGDGSAWVGKKYTGTLPVGVIFRVMLSGMPFEIGAATTEFNFGQYLKVGGANRGDGKITVGRDAGSADSTWYYDTATGHTYFIAGNNLRLGGDANTAFKLSVNSTGCGFNGTNPVAKVTITGAKGGNAALASLLTQLASTGLLTDSTT